VEIAGKYFQGAALCSVFCTALRAEKLLHLIFQMEQRLDHLQPPAFSFQTRFLFSDSYWAGMIFAVE
jgi:hypothetical protein